ncbi:hypothetical protein K4L44_04685 [Halosquirtibacter laminarini]|uniref:Uncharacterized protein n=1 Tax=Halosquirtibacter laminarini TaxID=3374600 RepID=A0AC61NHK5_9BACT|nr:hypothetical protein K4L44_04685 [Prolixibacteraceae bacterium]
MDKRKIASSQKTRKLTLDDDYTLFEDGTVLHEYDNSQFDFNKEDWIELKDVPKERLSDFRKSVKPEDADLLEKLLANLN